MHPYLYLIICSESARKFINNYPHRLKVVRLKAVAPLCDIARKADIANESSIIHSTGIAIGRLG